MDGSEAEVQAHIQITGPMHGCMLMRNNSGALKDDTGRVVRYGLGNVSKQYNDKIKSADLIGFTCRVIQPDDVGKTFAIFTAVECKRLDWRPSATDARESAQLAFINWIRNHGGYAGFANSIESFKRILGL